MVYIEDTSKEAADLIYKAISSEIQQRAKNKKRIILQIKDSYLKHHNDEGAPTGPLCKVALIGDSPMGDMGLYVFSQTEAAADMGRKVKELKNRFMVRMEVHESLVILWSNWDSNVEKAYLWLVAGVVQAV